MSLNDFIEKKTGVKTHGKYNERNPYSMADSPKNEDESRNYANALASSGHYPVGLDGCFTVGISGGCGAECWVFQSGLCEIPSEIFENTDDEYILELYDNGYYEKEIEDFLKDNNKLYLLDNKEV